VRLLSRWALREFGLVRLALHTHPENVASQRVAERAGFTREGTLRSLDTRGGMVRDIVSFSLLPGDLD
jgi:RimJ/RimL family protein N-acetyltransferase